jgi:O-antigen/teichoic acid export membrane protein
MPSRLALWGLNLSNRLLLVSLASLAAAGVFAASVRVAQVVMLLVIAFQLAWPPFAYSIEDDGEARRVYRAVLTWWMLVALWIVLGLALLRDPLFALLAAPRFAAGADPMAVYALGLAFYGGYYVVGVAVGRVKRTQFNWVVTGLAALINVGLCLVLIPDRGSMGAALSAAVAYAVMALLMTVRAQQVFPVGYEWGRIAMLLGLGALLFLAGDALLPDSGVAGVAGRVLVALCYPLVLLVTGFFKPDERRRLRSLAPAR